MRVFTGKRKLWFIVPALAASVLLIGACSSDDEETATPTETAIASETATEAATETATATEAASETATATETAAANTVLLGGNEALGPFLTDAEGKTLYTFANDEAGVSNCADTCAENWPPLLVAEGDATGGEGIAGTLGVIDRADGGRQVTYNDQPLYYFAADAAPGDTSGQAVNEVWFVVAP